MDRNEAITALNGIDGACTEEAHCDADQILLKFLADNGHKEIAEAWERVNVRCDRFWYG